MLAEATVDKKKIQINLDRRFLTAKLMHKALEMVRETESLCHL